MANALRMTKEEVEAYRRRRGWEEKNAVGVSSKPSTRGPSKIERRFEQQLVDAGVAWWQRDYFFLPERDFELDFAWPLVKVAVEVQGQAHRIKGKWKRDVEKRALALLAGWRVLEVGGDEVRSGRGLAWLKELLG